MHVEKPTPYFELLTRVSPEGLMRAVQAADRTKPTAAYIHWDQVRHLEPPAGLSRDEWWLQLKMPRIAGMRPIPLTDADDNHFTYCLPDPVLRLLHHVDQRCSGEIAMPAVVTADEQARQHYLVNSLMEEAIRSSQLEGATTSRKVAKELLRSGRVPKDRGEQMILNNYRALQFMRGMGQELTPEAVLELQRILTEGTLDDEASAGRLQAPGDERIAVFDHDDGTPVHIPPPADQLPRRLREMCEFANEDADAEPFIHPVVRGILLHFWLAYDHPFEDGNGRTARALFYWYMRTHGYWLVEYLSISHILRKAPAQYMRSFLLTETDENDTTYFLLYQLEVIERAIDQLHAYLKRKVSEVRMVERLIDRAPGFNHRQMALLADALRHGDGRYSFGGHARSHGVTHETARTDLRELARRRLLLEHRIGRRILFAPADDLADRLSELAEEQPSP